MLVTNCQSNSVVVGESYKMWTTVENVLGVTHGKNITASIQSIHLDSILSILTQMLSQRRPLRFSQTTRNTRINKTLSVTSA